MTQVTLKRWDGGVAQSERPETINEHSNNSDFQGQGGNGGFNVFADPFKLIKLTAPTVNETASGASVVSGECPVFDAAKRSTDGLIIGYGMTSLSGSSVARFYRKDSSITGQWQQNSQTGNGINSENGAYCILYKDLFFGYSSSSAASEARLYKYVSDSSQTLIDTVSDYAQYFCPRPVVHSQDKRLYYASNKTVRYYDGTSAAAAITTDFPIVSMCEYGTYLAIGCQSPKGGVIYLWGRDTSLTTFQDVIQVDNGNLKIIENIDGYLVAVTQTPYDPYSLAIPVTYSSAGTVNVRMYIGGTMKLVKKATLGNNEQNSQQSLLSLKMIRDGRLFFSTGSNYLWSFGINKNNEYVLAKDYQIVYTNRTLISLYGIFSLGEYLFGCQRTTTGSPGDGLLQRTDGTFSSVDLSSFTTPVNPAMPLEDRIRMKQLTRIYIKVYSVSNSSAIEVKYKFDGAASFTDAISETGITTGYRMFECTLNADSTSLGEGRDLVLQIRGTKQVDVIEAGYDYDLLETLID